MGEHDPAGMMRLSLRPALLLAAAFLLTVPAGAQQEKGARYVSPSGAFSIALDGTDRIWTPGDEDVSDHRIIVDFRRLGAGIPLTWQRSIEWIKLDKPLDPMEMDFQANAVVNGYLEGRFGDKLAVADRSKSRDSQGRLTYTFAAKGLVGGMPAYWQGTVLIFDSGVALVSELIAQPSQHKFDPVNGIIWQDAVYWARSLRPGP